MSDPNCIPSVEKIRNDSLSTFGYRVCHWQAEICRHLLLRRYQVYVSTAATGAGKSSTFFLPLSHENDGVTFLVVPLKDLGKQMAETSTKLGFSSVNVTSETFDEHGSQLIKVSALILASQGYLEH